ncbi:MAG: SGNH/GDSL hydrolase family protein [Bacteroidota bacterium]
MKHTLLSLFIVSSCWLYAQPSDSEILAQYKRWSSMRDDWPDLSRYQAANEALDPPAPGERRVVFMGNSITDAWIRVSPEFFEGKPYIDRGISGQTTPQMLVRFRQDVIDLNPHAVVILAGTNDIAGNTGPSTQEMIAGNLASMAEVANANGIKVVMASVLPAFNYRWRPEVKDVAQKIVDLNAWIKSYCEEKGFVYLDYHTPMKDERNGLPKKYSEDGVHPTKAGYAVMEELAEKTLRKLMDQ